MEVPIEALQYFCTSIGQIIANDVRARRVEGSALKSDLRGIGEESDDEDYLSNSSVECERLSIPTKLQLAPIQQRRPMSEINLHSKLTRDTELEVSNKLP